MTPAPAAVIDTPHPPPWPGTRAGARAGSRRCQTRRQALDTAPAVDDTGEVGKPASGRRCKTWPRSKTGTQTETKTQTKAGTGTGTRTKTETSNALSKFPTRRARFRRLPYFGNIALFREVMSGKAGY